MTRFLTLITLLATLFVAHASDYLRYVDRAEKAIEEEQWDRAATYLVEAMRSEPANAANVMLMSNLGMVRFYAGHDSLAVVTLTQAHDMEPEAMGILALRARVLRHMRRDIEAADDYTQILQRDTANVEALAARGGIALQIGDLAAARRDIDRLESLNPDDQQTWLLKALLLTSQKQPSAALQYYNRLIEAQPDADFYAARARCHLALNQLSDAADDIALGLELQPDDPDLYTARAVLNDLRHLPDDAKADRLKASQLGSR